MHCSRSSTTYVKKVPLASSHVVMIEHLQIRVNAGDVARYALIEDPAEPPALYPLPRLLHHDVQLWVVVAFNTGHKCKVDHSILENPHGTRGHRSPPATIKVMLPFLCTYSASFALRMRTKSLTLHRVGWSLMLVVQSHLQQRQRSNTWHVQALQVQPLKDKCCNVPLDTAREIAEAFAQPSALECEALQADPRTRKST